MIAIDAQQRLWRGGSPPRSTIFAAIDFWQKIASRDDLAPQVEPLQELQRIGNFQTLAARGLDARPPSSHLRGRIPYRDPDVARCFTSEIYTSAFFRVNSDAVAHVTISKYARDRFSERSRISRGARHQLFPPALARRGANITFAPSQPRRSPLLFHHPRRAARERSPRA